MWRQVSEQCYFQNQNIQEISINFAELKVQSFFKIYPPSNQTPFMRHKSYLAIDRLHLPLNLKSLILCQIIMRNLPSFEPFGVFMSSSWAVWSDYNSLSLLSLPLHYPLGSFLAHLSFVWLFSFSNLFRVLWLLGVFVASFCRLWSIISRLLVNW